MNKTLLPALCSVMLGGWSACAQDAETLVAAGRAHLVRQDITSANASFAEAVRLAPEHPAANALYAASRLLVLPTAPVVQAFLDRLGVSRTNRNIYPWKTSVPRDTNGVPVVPAGMSAAEATALLRTNLLPEIAAAAANLAKISNTNFLLTLASNETSLAEVTLDYGDILLLRAGLHATEYLSYTLSAWNLDAQLTAIRALATNEATTIEQVELEYPSLLTFRTTNDLAAAKGALTNAVALYLQASELIRHRPGNVTRFFNYAPEMFEDEIKFRRTLTDVRDSLDKLTTLREAPEVALHLGRMFDTPQSLRALLPEFVGNRMLADSLPDETFGGVVVGVDREELLTWLGTRFGVAAWLAMVRPQADQPFQFDLHGQPGASYGVLWSQDLRNWSESTRTLAEAGGVRLWEPAGPRLARRFFRALELEGAANDNFANRQTILGSDVTVYGRNDAATREFGELPHSEFGAVQKTVWWSWTAPANGLLTISTSGSEFEPSLALYVGGAVLTRVPELSYHLFPVVAGVNYNLVVGSAALPFENSGWFKLQLRLFEPVPNDHFVNRLWVSGSPVQLTGHCVGATQEAGEAIYAGANQKSVWWSWTPPGEGRFVIAPPSSQEGFGIAVYTGSSLANLTRVFVSVKGRAVFHAKAGTPYQIMVFCGGDEFESFEFNLRQVTPPANDDFANRASLAGTMVSAQGRTLGSLSEPGEPRHGKLNYAFSSWWTWTAPANGAATVTAWSDETPLVVAVYTGWSVAELSPVSANVGLSGVAQARFHADSGTAYQIAVDGYPAEVRLSVDLVELPASGSVALIPAGPFQMGDTFGEGGANERPVHTVSVSAFYLDKTLVTKTLWDLVYGWAVANGYGFDNRGGARGPAHPVHSINWYDAVKWCNARSQLEGRTPAYYTDASQATVYKSERIDLGPGCVKWTADGYRLPTEAEWEKAARGGLAGKRFPWGNTITHNQANYYSSSNFAYDTSQTRGCHPDYGEGTSPVGSFAPNDFGLFDMAGNLWEWCWDWHDGSWYGKPEATSNDTRGPPSGTYRVLRGGAWIYYAYYARCACHNNFTPADYCGYIGLRCGRGQ